MSVDDEFEERRLELLSAIAEAASDMALAKRDRQFASLNGGVRNIEAELFVKVSAYESFVSENIGD
jgi:hypothetical protein